MSLRPGNFGQFEQQQVNSGPPAQQPPKRPHDGTHYSPEESIPGFSPNPAIVNFSNHHQNQQHGVQSIHQGMNGQQMSNMPVVQHPVNHYPNPHVMHTFYGQGQTPPPQFGTTNPMIFNGNNLPIGNIPQGQAVYNQQSQQEQYPIVCFSIILCCFIF